MGEVTSPGSDTMCHSCAPVHYTMGGKDPINSTLLGRRAHRKWIASGEKKKKRNLERRRLRLINLDSEKIYTLNEIALDLYNYAAIPRSG